MSHNTIITIGRQYGSGGHEIGEKLAEKLGIPFYDKQLLKLAAKESGLLEEVVDSFDEKPDKSFLYSLVVDPYSALNMGSYENSLNYKVVSASFDAIKKIEILENIKLAGLHIHRTSHSRSIGFYKASIDFACKVIKKYKLRLNYIDVGGGYFGIFPNKPSYQQYTDAFLEVLEQYNLQHRLCLCPF